MKRLLTVLTLLFTLCFVFSGCSSKTSAPPQTDGDKGGQQTQITAPSSYNTGFFAFQGKKQLEWAQKFYDNLPDKLTVLIWYDKTNNSRQEITDKKVMAEVFAAMCEINIKDATFKSTQGPTITYNFGYNNGDNYSFQFDGKDRLLMSESSGQYISNAEKLFSVSAITIIK